MKKSNQFSNKLIARKDLINSISVASAFLIVIFGIIMFLLVLRPEQDVNGKITFLIEQRMMYTLDGSYNFSAEQENVLLVAMIGGLALGISQFEFLHRKKYASTLFGFSIKRSKLFLNRLIIPLVLALLCIALPHLIALKINIETFGFQVDMFPWFFFHLLRIIRIFITAYTISIIACVFTGRTVEAIAGAFSIATLPCAVVSLVDMVFDSVLFGYSGTFYSQTTDILVKADPIFISSLLYSRGLNYVVYYPKNTPLDTDCKIQLIFSVIWIIISFAAVWFIKNYFVKKYKPESSGFKGINKCMSVLISFTSPIFITTLVIDLLDGYFSPSVSNSINLIIICIAAVVGVIASLVFGFVIHFTFKKFKTSAIGGFALVGTLGLSVILGITGLFGAYHKVPEAKDIERIEISAPFCEFLPSVNGYSDFSKQYIFDSSTALIITDKEDIETALELHEKASQKNDEATSSVFEVSYILKDGTYLVRKYKYLGADATEEIMKLWDTKAAKELYKKCLFPKLDDVDNNDSYYTLLINRYSEQPFIKDYDDEDAYLSIVTRDGQVKSVLDEITEAEFIKLKNAVYKDICSLSASQWFTPKEAQIGTLGFDIATYINHAYQLNIYINSDMVNTIKTLKDIDLYKHFECEKKIDKVFVADIKEYMQWENRSFFSLNEKDLAIHQPYFTYRNDDASYVLFDSEVEGYDIQPAKEITDKLQIKSLTEKGFIAYNIMNNGKIVFVKYEDDTTSSYVIPYEE